MTGDHGQVSYDGTATHGTTTTATTGPAPGWYTDPGAPEQLRYFDGSAWTHHVAPRPVPAPVPGAPTAGAATAATGRHSAVPAVPATAIAPGTSSAVRILVTVSIVVVTLMAVGGGIQGVLKGRATPARADGPTLTLSNVAPETVLGRMPSTGAAAERNRITLRGQLTAAMGTIPGAGTPGFELYGPGPTSAPARGLGVVMVAWTPSSAPFGQDEFAAGFSDGAVRGFAGRATTTSSPDGGVVVCHESVQQEQQTTLCLWIRSGTGLVMVSEYGVPLDTVRADLAGVVRQMARP